MIARRSPSSSSSLLLLLIAAFAATLAGVVQAQSSGFTQPGGPNAPLTTNNAQTNACIQFGSCSTAGEGASTISQATPVVPPPSSAVSNPFPTATAQDPAFISSLAAAGAQAAFSSRGGQTLSLGASGAGLTSLPGTSPSAGQAPTSISSAAGNAAGNANRNAAPRSSSSQGGAAVAMLLAGVCAGAAYLL